MPQGPIGESVLWVKHCFQSLLARMSFSVAFLPDKWEVEEGAIFIQAGRQAGRQFSDHVPTSYFMPGPWEALRPYR